MQQMTQAQALADSAAKVGGIPKDSALAGQLEAALQ